MQKILIIDDEIALCELISAEAEALGLDSVSTTEPAKFLSLLSPEVTLIVMDLMMPEMDGIELLRKLAQQGCNAGIILMSGVARGILETAQTVGEALGLSIVGHLLKPFHLADLDRELKKHAVVTIPSPLLINEPQGFEDDDLRRAIETEEFVLHYEPQLEISSGRVLGVEALVRWQHPELGLIYPSGFASQLDGLGLQDALSWIMLRRGMSELGMFANSLGYLPRLSVKVSMHSLYDLSFPDKLEIAARNFGVPLNLIALEITGSGLIQQLSHSLDVLTRLRMKSVLLSIYDFGSGFSVMQHLHHIPATELKIDKSFVQNIGRHDRDEVLAIKTIEIAHELGMTAVAVGVETEAQLAFLRLNRCDFAQGYLFSRPVSPNVLVDWFTSYRAGRISSSSSRQEGKYR